LEKFLCPKNPELLPIAKMEENISVLDDVKEKLQFLQRESRLLCNIDPSGSLEKAEEALKLAQKHGFEKDAILARENIAYQFWHQGNLEKAIEIFEETRARRIALKYYASFDWCISNLSQIHWGQGNFDIAFQIIYDAIPLMEETGDEKDKCLCYWAIAVFYYDLKDFERSQENYFKSWNLSNGDPLLDANISAYNLIGLGCCAKETGSTQLAVEYFESALAKCTEYGQQMERARCLYEIGLIFHLQSLYDKATFHLTESLQIRRNFGYVPGLISSLMALSDTEKEKGNFSTAVEMMKEAIALSEELASKTKRFQCYEKLASLYRCLSDYEQALVYLDKFHQLRSDVYGERSNNRIKQLESNFAKLQSEKEAEIQRLINVELKTANDLIKSKNQKILDSVHYARLIQQAILPSDEVLKAHFPDHFLLYIPKDIVSGDFYWTEQIQDKILFAVADCTGHGVPGAMMSVMCSTALTRSVNESGLDSPGKILGKTAAVLSENFSRSQSQLSDGMHIALGCFEPSSMKLTFAASYHSGLLIRGNDSIRILSGDKQAIGNTEEIKPFAETQIQLMMGDCLYLYSDGYADQFGGPDEKKIRAAALRELISANRHLSMLQQKEALLAFFENWKGDHPQIDDVCVMGIRF